jgi:hypothetical protein
MLGLKAHSFTHISTLRFLSLLLPERKRKFSDNLCAPFVTR